MQDVPFLETNSTFVFRLDGKYGIDGVYIGPTPPTDPDIKVWIDTSGSAGDVEMVSNKVTSMSGSSTNTQYPSAKSVYDALATKEGTISDLATIRSGAALGATALQSHQDISGKLDKAQGVAHAGQFLVVGSDGNVTTVTMQTWQGGSY